MERITFLQIDLWSDPGALLAVTPVGKVPSAHHRPRRGDQGQHDHLRISRRSGLWPTVIDGDRFEGDGALAYALAYRLPLAGDCVTARGRKLAAWFDDVSRRPSTQATMS
jgi:hypothetical protein